MKVSIQFNANLPVKVTRRQKWFLASCPVLDVHAQGETEKGAKDHLTEALSVFLASCFERGTLDAVLKDCGFKAVASGSPQRLKPNIPSSDYINVPIPFLVNNSRKECRA